MSKLSLLYKFFSGTQVAFLLLALSACGSADLSTGMKGVEEQRSPRSEIASNKKNQRRSISDKHTFGEDLH